MEYMNLEKEVDLRDIPIKTNNKKKTKLIIAISIGSIIIVTIIILAVCLSKKGNKKEEDNTQESNNNENSQKEGNEEEEEDDSFIEKEQPELNEETKQLISAYHKNPTDENYLLLREAVINNYNGLLLRKEAKLEELKIQTAGKPGGEEKVAEMEEIVQDMYITYWNRINNNMLRFVDKRLLKWSIQQAANYEYIPVMGAGETVYIKRTPVINSEYEQFINEKGYQIPSNRVDGKYSDGESEFPVNYISYKDVQQYCNWLTSKDGINTYRLPSESEWELAAGHMPKDADFNNNIVDSRVSVYEYATKTRGAHGAIDFWGNVWEWTSTIRTTTNNVNMLAVKGGSQKSDRTDCRTENRKESRNEKQSYDDVGFRVIQVINGNEPEKSVDFYTLDAPVLTAKIIDNKIKLSWGPVDNAKEYQIFEYYEDTNLFKMVNRTTETSYELDYTEDKKNCKYLVQSLSYIELSDNVYGELSVKPT